MAAAVGPRGDKVGVGLGLGAVVGGDIPVQNYPQGGVGKPGEEGGELAARDGLIREKAAHLIGAGHNPPLIELEDVPLVGGVFVHIGDEGVGGVPHGDHRVIDGEEQLRRQGAGGQMGGLGPAGRLIHPAVQRVVQDAVAFEVEDIGQIPQLLIQLLGDVVHGPHLRVAVEIEAAHPGGKADDLLDGDVVIHAKEVRRLPPGESQREEGGHIGVEPVRLLHVQEPPVIGGVKAAGRSTAWTVRPLHSARQSSRQSSRAVRCLFISGEPHRGVRGRGVPL